MLIATHSADDGQEPQAGASPSPAAPPAPAPVAAPAPPEPAPDADAPTLSPAEVRALRSEAQNLRRRLREFEQQAEAQQRERMTEVERLRADHAAATERLAGLEAEVRGYRLRDAIGAAVEPAALPPAGEGQEPAANPLHGISPRLAARLIDPAALEYGDDGRPRPASLRRALEALALEYPEIRPAPAAPGAAPRIPAQPPAGGGGARPNAAQQFIGTRYTALPPNVTKR